MKSLERSTVSDPVLSADEVQAFMVAEFPQMADQFTIENVSPMSARVSMTPKEAHLRPGGTISGPTIFALADCAVYFTIIAMVGPEALAVTTNASIDFMRKPQLGADLVADVQLLKLGRVLAVGEVRVRSQGRDAVIARATFTYSRPPKS
ncbi:MAG: PaaI family thioesterase [Paracoccaceae bacterium]